MHKKLILLSIVFFITSYVAQAQFNKERYGADYTFIGKGNSDEGGDVSFEKYDFRITFPKKLKNPGSRLFHKFEYAKTNIDYGTTPIVDAELESFHSISYTFGFAKPLKNGWYFNAFISPSVASNFESSINFDELNLFGMALFTKPINKQKNLMLSLGALYSNSLGFPAPLPVVSLMWKPDNKWTINFGFPRFDINYKASESTLIGTNLILAGENFTLTDDIVADGSDQKVDNIRMMNVAVGLFLNQKITKKISLNVNSGYTLTRNFEFNDGSDKVVDFDLDNNLYIKAGFSIGL
jgi:hypothetical protein